MSDVTLPDLRVIAPDFADTTFAEAIIQATRPATFEDLAHAMAVHLSGLRQGVTITIRVED